MHLPQIAALLKLAEDLIDPGRAARPAMETDGFLSVFSGGDVAEGQGFSGTGAAAEASPVPTAFAEITPAPGMDLRGDQALGSDALWTGADMIFSDASADPLSLSDYGPEPEPAPAETGQVPAETHPTPRGETGDRPDREPSQDPATDPLRLAMADAAPPDGPLLQGIAMPVPAPEPGGVHPSRAGEIHVPKVIPSEPSPKPVGDRADRPVRIDAAPVAVRAATGAMPRALAEFAVAAEKPVLSAPDSVPDAPSGTARGGVASDVPQAEVMPLRTGRLAQFTDMPRDAAARLPDGQGRSENTPGGRAAEAKPVEATASAASPQGASANVPPSGTGQTAVAGTGPLLPSGYREIAPEAYVSRAEARSGAASDGPATPDAPKAESGAMSGAAPATPPAASRPDIGAMLANGAARMSGEGEGQFNADLAFSGAVLGETRAAVPGPQIGTAGLLQSPDTPRLVALQIAEVVRASGERAVELRLQPEELGRVQLTMSQDATGTLTVSLNVERAETLDLLRRNIDLLSADLQELGYESINFSFHGDGAGEDPDAQRNWTDKPGARDANGAMNGGDPPQSVEPGAEASGDGIDIRL